MNKRIYCDSPHGRSAACSPDTGWQSLSGIRSSSDSTESENRVLQDSPDSSPCISPE